ncbi:hypothetical protein BBEV_0874 [Salisediminibacterium beveridgei]|uniref:Uncharacterized protein n=1 Tax=Salisediminibacterium beveridgei TaxID=632773 RepID=A0A1D7QTE3_9BACI|nr:hypothetical protein BBEV_0874 [Salisediminibacterium beveridgei]
MRSFIGINHPFDRIDGARLTLVKVTHSFQSIMNSNGRAEDIQSPEPENGCSYEYFKIIQGKE